MGCVHAAVMADDRRLCPFCRTPQLVSDGELIKRTRKRVKADDADALNHLGFCYDRGINGLPQDYNKAMELLLRAGELGCAMAYHKIAHSHLNGEGVERDEKKAKHYWELAAMGGHVEARHCLGIFEHRAGNIERAVKHYMISAGAGYDESLKAIQEGFVCGHVTKDDFERALRAHTEAKDEMRSDQRDAAAARIYMRETS
jgi:TPR repeat protein